MRGRHGSRGTSASGASIPASARAGLPADSCQAEGGEAGVGVPASRERFQRRSSTRLWTRTTTSATAVSGSSASVGANSSRTTAAPRMPRAMIQPCAPVSRRIRKWPTPIKREDDQRDHAADGGDGVEVEPDGQDDRDDRGEEEPGRQPSTDTAGKQRWELADGHEVLGQPGGGIQPGVGRAGGREERSDGHQPVSGLPEHRLRRNGERGAAGVDDLVDREGPEHAERDGHVDRRSRCRWRGTRRAAAAVPDRRARRR